MFLNTNIRVWVLTGDKLETAIEIAKSCKLIQKNFKQILLHASSPHHQEPNYDSLSKEIHSQIIQELEEC